MRLRTAMTSIVTKCLNKISIFETIFWLKCHPSAFILIKLSQKHNSLSSFSGSFHLSEFEKKSFTEQKFPKMHYCVLHIISKGNEGSEWWAMWCRSGALTNIVENGCQVGSIPWAISNHKGRHLLLHDRKNKYYRHNDLALW